jgi:hypothetical protein
LLEAAVKLVLQLPTGIAVLSQEFEVTPTDTTDAYVNDKRLDAGVTPPGAFAFHSHHVPSATSAPSRTFRFQVQLLPLDFRIKVQGTAITPRSYRRSYNSYHGGHRYQASA